MGKVRIFILRRSFIISEDKGSFKGVYKGLVVDLGFLAK